MTRLDAAKTEGPLSDTNQRKPWRILIVGGHPADVFDCAGGTLCQHIRQGDQVTALVMTKGARVHDVVISDAMRQREVMPSEEELLRLMEERSEIKRAEVREACEILGIADVRFMFYDDRILMVKDELIGSLGGIIREVRPHIIITHYPFDNGGIADQHAITGQIVLNAIWNASGVEPGDPNPPHRVAQVFFMGMPASYGWNVRLAHEFSAKCDVFVDITEVAHLKVQAIAKLQSQHYDLAMGRKSVESCDGNSGMGVGVAYAEPFMSYMNEVYKTLPVSDYLLQLTSKPEQETKDRICYLVTHDPEKDA